MILIVTAAEDITAKVVIDALHALGRRDVFRLNLEAAHDDYAFTWTAGRHGITWSLRSHVDPATVVTSENVRAVYWRRLAVAQDGPMMSIPQSGRLDHHEVFWSLKWLLESLPARLFPFGHPEAHAAGDNKHRQTAAALRTGFTLPESCHSNDIAALRDFIRERQEVAIKAMRVSAVTTTGHAADARHIACKAFDPDFLAAQLEEAGPTQLFCQEAMQRRQDLRIMVFPHETVAASIDTTGLPDNKLDWRESTLDVAHGIVPLPEAFEAQLRQFLSLMGLTAGFFDFAQPEEGPPVFFECNTNAEWYWVEWMTGHPLSEAVARELIRTADAAASESPEGPASGA
jgi:hypothetical protein